MGTERLRILELIEQGKISAAEGLELLKAIEVGEPELSPQVSPSNYKNRFLRIRVEGEKIAKVNVNVPLSLIRSASKLVNIASGMIPAEAKAEMERKGIFLEKLDLDEIVQAIEEGASDGKLVDVDVDDPKEGRIKVEVFVD